MTQHTSTKFSTISREDAAAMVQAYDPRGNTKCVWFSIEVLSAMMEKLRSPASVSAGVDGLRIYYAQYTAGTVPFNRQEDIGRNTLILVSTIADGDSHQDYFPTVETRQGDEPGDDGGILINHGELCPEKCNGSSL